jgi:D-alanyl-D-alanine carboxypeptidase
MKQTTTGELRLVLALLLVQVFTVAASNVAAWDTCVQPRAPAEPTGGSDDFLAAFEPLPATWQLSKRSLRLGAKLASLTELGEIVDQCVIRDMERLATPGASVAVAVDGALVYERGYGVKRISGHDPVDADTVFRIGSITKQMTAVALLQQVATGAVRLDEAVTRSVPELWVAGTWSVDDVTIHHLLSHTSGFPDLPLQADGPTDDGALSRWATDHGAFGLHAPPGSFFNYSNPNYMLAGLVIERASGLEYHQYVETRVWEPAGLTATTFDPEAVVAGGNFSYGHQLRSSGQYAIYSPDSYDNWVGAPAGWAFSTAPELVSWALLMMDGGGEILEASLVEAMQQPRVRSYFSPTARYAYGLFIDDIGGVRIVYHGGNISGWGAFVLWAPEQHFAVAVLANAQQSLTEAAGCIAGAVLPFSTDPPPVTATDPSSWRRFAGTYMLTSNLGEASEAIVTHHGDSMSLTIIRTSAPDFTSPMIQMFFNTFAADLDGDGLLDSDCSFVDGLGQPAPVRWLRNRRLVGQRVAEVHHGIGRVAP